MRTRRTTMCLTMLPRTAAIPVTRISRSVISERSPRRTMNGCHLTTIAARTNNERSRPSTGLPRTMLNL
uniref:Putative secreted peptide n=1 Tax=Anopheles braziliensis TaxID=58242 RepID=A0A2M3ZUA8_9DIPT